MQDHVLITPGIFPLRLPCGKQFQYFFNSQQWFDTWRSRIKTADNLYISCLLTQGTKIIKIQKNIDYSVPRRARYMQKLLEKAPGYSILD